MKWILLLGAGAAIAWILEYGGGIVTEAIFNRIEYALALRVARNKSREAERPMRRPADGKRITRTTFADGARRDTGHVRVD